MCKNVRTLSRWALIVALVALAGCRATPAPTATPLPPTATPVPPTSTPEPEPWQQKADMPVSVSSATASVVADQVYLIGGGKFADEPARATVQVYDPATDAWVQRAEMPTPRSFLASSVVNGKIFVFGGSPTWGLALALPTLEVYDPATDTWEKRADMPTPRSGFSTQAIDGKIYLFGGDQACARRWPETHQDLVVLHFPERRMEPQDLRRDVPAAPCEARGTGPQLS